MVKKYKKSVILYLFLVFFMAICMSIITYSIDVKVSADEYISEVQLLSELNEDECYQFITEHGVELPEGLELDDDVKSFIKNVIQNVENDPNYHFVYNYFGTLNFAEEIKVVVNNYYGVQAIQEDNIQTCASYQLQDSFVQNSSGEWVSSGGYWSKELFEYYNCYAYAINRTENPPEYSTGDEGIQYLVGAFAGPNTNWYNLTILELAEKAVADLRFLGYDVTLFTERPSNIYADENLICVRREKFDYHFMKYNQLDNSWYHKPGSTAILKYKHEVTEDRVWTNEHSIGGREYEGDYAYNSEIYYISYKEMQTHTYTVTFDKQGGTGGTERLYVEVGSNMPTAIAPTRAGYQFQGYYSGPNGTGTKYYNADMTSAHVWDQQEITTLYAYWQANTYTITFDKQGGAGGTDTVQILYGSSMPQGLQAPTKEDYIFAGYFDQPNGLGNVYYDASMTSVRAWNKVADTTLYAYWTDEPVYVATIMSYNGENWDVSVKYGEKLEMDFVPYLEHYEFGGVYSMPQGRGTCYIKSKLIEENDIFNMGVDPDWEQTWDIAANESVYVYWIPLQMNYQYDIVAIGEDVISTGTVSIASGEQTTITAPTLDGYTFDSWTINDNYYTTESVTYTFTLHRSYLTGEITIKNTAYTGSATYSDGHMSLAVAKNESEDDSCIVAGTLITLADGRQVPVESLKGNEELLVWNIKTGKFDSAPILFVDSDKLAYYKIINLRFSDGTVVKVVDEHGFWDYNLSQYVYMREDAGKYIGHWFQKQTTDSNGKLVWTKVQLEDVTISIEKTTTWSPVTYSHLCLYVNGMLSMPGGIEGMFNIFDVDSDKIKINQKEFHKDVKEYGLFTYEEFASIYNVNEEMFNACNGKYLKVAIGKGLISEEEINSLIVRYAEFFS